VAKSICLGAPSKIKITKGKELRTQYPLWDNLPPFSSGSSGTPTAVENDIKA